MHTFPLRFTTGFENHLYYQTENLINTSRTDLYDIHVKFSLTLFAIDPKVSIPAHTDECIDVDVDAGAAVVAR